jgi:UDP-N-acetylmuramate dehydrogenase
LIVTDLRLESLAHRLGDSAELDAPLARYSAAGIGGPADLLVVASGRDDLVRAVTEVRAAGLRYKVFGGLTNCLVADEGIRGVVILNQARAYRFEEGGRLYAESGASVVKVAREAVRRGLGGLTWAVGLPGTVGGMVVNNAGAFGGETSRVLASAEVLGPAGGPEWVEPAWFDFKYRCSRLKGAGEEVVVLAATFRLREREPAHLQAKAEEYTTRRCGTQPPGRTLGSTFKNPPDDYAGRLIEAAGLKGTRVGGVVVSPHHANFLINEGSGTAADYLALIRLVQEAVERRFGVRLEPEIELIT